ncbi:MAG: hypothetical protein AAFR38_03885 [Planctomycetota bacterium]
MPDDQFPSRGEFPANNPDDARNFDSGSPNPSSDFDAPSNSPLPTLSLEDYEPELDIAEPVKNENAGSTKFAFLGAGQCGGKIAQSFYELGYRKVVAVNTAYADLAELEIPNNQKVLMDIGGKHGAGKDMNRGFDAAEQYRQEIIHAVKKVFATNVDHCFVTCGAGGGTGGGSVTSLIKTLNSAAKHIGLKKPEKRIGVICTLPTVGESASPRVAQNTVKVVDELTRLADSGQISPLIFIDNERISRLYPGLTVKSFWPTVNDTVAGLFDIFNRLSALTSPYSSFDPGDYQNILECGGCHLMGLTKVRDINDKYAIAEAMKKNFERTLLADGFRLASAKTVGAIVVGGKNQFATVAGLQDSINHGFDVLTDLTGNATVHRGVFEDDRDELRVYTIVGGLDKPADRINELRSAA